MANDNTTGNGNSKSNGGRNGGIIGVASKTVSALAGFPMLLVLALLNAATLGMVTYLVVRAAEYRAQERTQLIELLRSCVIKHLDRNGGVDYKTPGWNGSNHSKNRPIKDALTSIPESGIIIK